MSENKTKIRQETYNHAVKCHAFDINFVHKNGVRNLKKKKGKKIVAIKNKGTTIR